MDLRELQEWFAPDELASCPHCLAVSALLLEQASVLICFGCGYIRWSGGETSVRELQGRGSEALISS